MPDVVVLGGGPAGSTAAALLARAGLDVVLLEKEQHPRFHVGESLLPYSERIWRRLGIWEQLQTQGFQRKWGAAFLFEPAGLGNQIDFARGIAGRHPLAFHVRRSVFDELLLRNAQRAGADVRERWTVAEVRFEGGRATGVRVVDPAGGEHRIDARLIVDASGRDCLIGRQLGLRRPDPALRQAAMFAHWEGAAMGLGREGGDLLVVGGPAGWYWMIPLDERTTSVGVVYPGQVARGRQGSAEDFYHQLLARSPEMSARLASGRRVVAVNAAADFSYRLDRFAGDGWVAVGDAAGFLDPVFSSGIYMGTAMAEQVADRAAPLLRHGAVLRGEHFRRYERYVTRGFDRFRRYIMAFYDPAFVELFSTDPPLELFRSAVVSILAGGIHDRDPRIWLGDQAFFLGLARERRLARAGKKRLPQAPACDGNLVPSGRLETSAR